MQPMLPLGEVNPTISADGGRGKRIPPPTPPLRRSKCRSFHRRRTIPVKSLIGGVMTRISSASGFWGEPRPVLVFCLVRFVGYPVS